MDKASMIMAEAIKQIWDAIWEINRHQKGFIVCPSFPKRITVIHESTTITSEFQ